MCSVLTFLNSIPGKFLSFFLCHKLTISSAGSTVEDLVPQLNIVVQSPEEGGSLSDPLNVIPDEYEDYVDYEEQF